MCVVWDGTPHPGFSRYSWDDDSFVVYLAHENYHEQPALACSGRDTAAPAITELAVSLVVQHDSGRAVCLLSKPYLTSRTGTYRGLRHCRLHVREYPGYFVLRRRPQQIRVLSFLGQALRVQYRVLLVLFLFQSHPTPVPTDIYGGEELRFIRQPALSEATPPAETLCLVRPVRSRSLSEAESVESPLHEIHSACLVLSRRASETILELAKILFR